MILYTLILLPFLSVLNKGLVFDTQAVVELGLLVFQSTILFFHIFDIKHYNVLVISSYSKYIHGYIIIPR